MKIKTVLGIDIGGTHIKGALVNIKEGVLCSEKIKIETPLPSLPSNIVEVTDSIVKQLQWKGPIGIGFPGSQTKSIVTKTNNLENSWENVSLNTYFTNAIGLPVYAINDADAAGLAEVKFGQKRKCKGLVFFVTIGTGIGTALFQNGTLIKNTELGQMLLPNGLVSEKYMSNSARKQEALEWSEWGKRVNEYFAYIESILSPELIIIGGGASRRFELFSHEITINTNVIPATFGNESGIIGAAYNVKKFVKKSIISQKGFDYL